MLYLLKNWVHSTQILIFFHNYHQNSGGGTSEAFRWYLRVDDPLVFIEGRDILFLYKYGWAAYSGSFEGLNIKKIQLFFKHYFYKSVIITLKLK